MSQYEFLSLEVLILKSLENGQWYVSLRSRGNGQVLSTSETYVSKWNAKRAARRMFPNIPAEVQGEKNK